MDCFLELNFVYFETSTSLKFTFAYFEILLVAQKYVNVARMKFIECFFVSQSFLLFFYFLKQTYRDHFEI